MRSQLVKPFLSGVFARRGYCFFDEFGHRCFVPTQFNQWANKQMTIPWSNYFFLLYHFAFVFITSMLAGSLSRIVFVVF